MCEVDGIEVTREDMPAWDVAVATLRRNFHVHMHLIRTSADARAEDQSGDLNANLAAAEI